MRWLCVLAFAAPAAFGQFSLYQVDGNGEHPVSAVLQMGEVGPAGKGERTIPVTKYVGVARAALAAGGRRSRIFTGRPAWAAGGAGIATVDRFQRGLPGECRGDIQRGARFRGHRGDSHRNGCSEPYLPVGGRDAVGRGPEFWKSRGRDAGLTPHHRHKFDVTAVYRSTDLDSRRGLYTVAGKSGRRAATASRQRGVRDTLSTCRGWHMDGDARHRRPCVPVEWRGGGRAAPAARFSGRPPRPAKQPARLGGGESRSAARTAGAGTLTLAFEPLAKGAVDAAIQLGAMGRSLPFTIAPGVTQVRFGDLTAVTLQTGTTAGRSPSASNWAVSPSGRASRSHQSR